jgi:hypothetical protein
MFKFRDLKRLMRSAELHGDPILLSLRGLAELLVGDKEQALADLSTSMTEIGDGDDATKGSVQDICLHAVWLADSLPDQAMLIHEWSRAVPNNTSAIIPFRRAKAFRLQGKYERALEEIQKCFDRITGNTEYARTFMEQAIREREIIEAVKSVRESQDKLESAVNDAKSVAMTEIQASQAVFGNEMREMEKNSLIRTIEVVTLFTAAVSFAIGGISIVGGSDPGDTDRLGLIFGFGTGLLTFAAFIFLAFEFVRLRSHERAHSLADILRETWPIIVAYLGLMGVNSLVFLLIR